MNSQPQAASPGAAETQPSDIQTAKSATAKAPTAFTRPMGRRKVTKAVVTSPEARRAAEARHSAEVASFIALGKMEKCPPRYALGLVNATLFGTEV